MLWASEHLALMISRSRTLVPDFWVTVDKGQYQKSSWGMHTQTCAPYRTFWSEGHQAKRSLAYQPWGRISLNNSAIVLLFVLFPLISARSVVTSVLWTSSVESVVVCCVWARDTGAKQIYPAPAAVCEPAESISTMPTLSNWSSVIARGHYC